MGDSKIELSLQEPLDRVHNLMRRIRSAVGDPVDLSARLFDKPREQQSFAQIIGVNHGAKIVARSDNRYFSGTNHREKENLSPRRIRTVKPRWPHNHRLDLSCCFDLFDQQFHLQLGAAVVHVWLIRRTLVKQVLRMWVEAEG